MLIVVIIAYEIVYNEFMDKLISLYKKHREIINYLVVGVIGTIVSIVTFAIFMKIGFDAVPSNIISWTIVVILMYILNRYFVFSEHATEKMAIIREMISFALARLFTLLLETLVIWLGIDVMKINSDFGVVSVKTFGQVLVIVLNFVFSKLFIFKNSKSTNHKA